eukprot:987940-Rhodomonas_salina.1
MSCAALLTRAGAEGLQHPELHAKELTEMRKLLASHCKEDAIVLSRCRPHNLSLRTCTIAMMCSVVLMFLASNGSHSTRSR